MGMTRLIFTLPFGLVAIFGCHSATVVAIKEPPKSGSYAGTHFLISKRLKMTFIEKPPILDIYSSSSELEGVFLGAVRDVPPTKKDIRADVENHFKSQWPKFDKKCNPGTIGPPVWHTSGENALYGRWGMAGETVHAE
jgi:hypothetical protein